MKSAPKGPRAAPNGSPDQAFLLPPSLGEHQPEIFLVLPGLNLHPPKLEPLGGVLLKRGHVVVHGFPQGYFQAGHPNGGGALVDNWLARLDGYREAIAARFPGAPISLLGFSLGGLLGLTWSLSRGGVLRRAVLVSPPLALKWYGRPLLRTLATVAPGSLMLPSRTPAAYRLHPGTTVAAYAALLDLGRRFRGQLGQNPDNGANLPPQFIAFSPSDELISTRFFSAYRRRVGEKVTLCSLAHQPRRGFPHHLGVDPATLGAVQWQGLVGRIGAWLGEPAGGPPPAGSRTKPPPPGRPL